MGIKLTIDTNLINVHGRIEAMNVLERWQYEGKIQLVGAERLRDETVNYPPAKSKVEAMPNVSEPTIWGISKWDQGYLSDGNAGPGYIDIAAILFPNCEPLSLKQSDQNDVMHIIGHAHSASKFFISSNTKHFINNGRQHILYKKFGIVVITPQDAVNRLVSEYGWIWSTDDA